MAPGNLAFILALSMAGTWPAVFAPTVARARRVRVRRRVRASSLRFSTQTTVVVIDGSKNPELIPQWSAWEYAFRVIGGGPRELPTSVYRVVSTEERALILAEAQASLRRDKACQERVEKLLPLVGKESQLGHQRETAGDPAGLPVGNASRPGSPAAAAALRGTDRVDQVRRGNEGGHAGDDSEAGARALSDAAVRATGARRSGGRQSTRQVGAHAHSHGWHSHVVVGTPAFAEDEQLDCGWFTNTNTSHQSRPERLAGVHRGDTQAGERLPVLCRSRGICRECEGLGFDQDPTRTPRRSGGRCRCPPGADTRPMESTRASSSACATTTAPPSVTRP